MKVSSFFCFIFSSLSVVGLAQIQITETIDIPCTEVKNQQRTGTCWSFATTSFLESELLRLGGAVEDVSEMYIVRNIYMDKARNYVLRQGKAAFSQGSLSHDVIRAVQRYGAVPEQIYTGRLSSDAPHDHSEMVSVLKGYLDGLLTNTSLSDRWLIGVEAILDTYLGRPPQTFEVEGITYHPKSYAMNLGIDPSAYIELTSFTHHPFYTSFILEIPDNYSNGSFFNVPIDELETTVQQALRAGYTVAWDGDVSEDGFSSKEGLALMPIDPTDDNLFKSYVKEMNASQENRQEAFESFSTTDDHLMHIVGMGEDGEGHLYYKIKNSWGVRGAHDGYLYMSSPYFRMKTVAIMLHKDALPDEMKKRM